VHSRYHEPQTRPTVSTTTGFTGPSALFVGGSWEARPRAERGGEGFAAGAPLPRRVSPVVGIRLSLSTLPRHRRRAGKARLPRSLGGPAARAF